MKLKRVNHPQGVLYGWQFQCPGCDESHMVNNTWECNGDSEKPTINPSILVYPHKQMQPDGSIVETYRCHSFVREGRIQFLSDCTHALAGQTVELPEIKES